MDVWEYFETKRREVRDASLVEDEGFNYIALDGSDDQQGRVWGRVGYDERAFLQISELVVVVESGVHREEYAYFFVMDGLELWGVERDPTHDPPDHEHDRDHNSQPCAPLSFKQALNRGWETHTQELELGKP